jgi:hypothetical protein
MTDESPYLTSSEAAAHLRKTLKGFDHFCVRHGVVPDARAGRIRLYLPASLDAVVQTMAARPRRRFRRVA